MECEKMMFYNEDLQSVYEAGENCVNYDLIDLGDENLPEWPVVRYKCTKCQNGQRVSQDFSGCSAGIARCQEMDPVNINYCAQCEPFYKLSADKRSCDEMCKTRNLWNEALCDECVEGYFHSEDKKSCVRLCVGTFGGLNHSQQMQYLKTHQLESAEADRCIQCAPLFALDDARNICEPLCARFDPANHNQCEECKPFYELSSDKGVCAPQCMRADPANPSRCLECGENLVPSADNSRCLEVPQVVYDNCEHLSLNNSPEGFSGKASCTQCDQGVQVMVSGINF